GGRGPRGNFFAGRGPGLAAVGEVVGGNEGVLGADVALDDDEVVEEDRRAAEAPFVVRVEEPAGAELAELLLPEQLAVDGVAVKPFRAEAGDDVLAVGGGGGVGVAGLHVPLDLGHAG